MKFQFNEPLLRNFIKVVDISLKIDGFKSLDKFIGIVDRLEFYMKNNNSICDFSELDMVSFDEVFNIAIKGHGLNVAYGILEIVNTLRSNPIIEETQEPEMQPIIIEPEIIQEIEEKVENKTPSQKNKT